MASLNSLIAAFNQKKKSLVKIKDRLNGKFKSNPTPTAGLIDRLQADLDNFVQIRTVFGDLAEQILETISDEANQKQPDVENDVINDLDSTAASYSELIEKFGNIRVKYGGKIAETSKSQSDLRVMEARPKLKDLEVPEFHGKPREFMNFKGMFEALVHMNPKYTDAEKLSFLKQSLKDDAAKILTDTTCLNITYPEAWSMVCEWYENKPMIINSLFFDLFSIKRMKDPSNIRSILLEIDAILRGLKSAGEEPENWGSILHYFVTTKLDDDTRKDWQNTRADNPIYPKYSDLKKFLLGRAQAAEANISKPKPIQPAYFVSPPRDKQAGAKKVLAAISTNKTCVCCRKAFHLLIECEEFRALSPSKRIELVRDSRLCFNCFNSRHQSKDCPKLPCKECKFKHHTMLHTEKPIPKSVHSTELQGGGISTAVDPKVCSVMQTHNRFILLPTVVSEFSCGNASGFIRILLDCASQATAVADTFVERYKLKTFRSSTVIEGFGITDPLRSNFACRLNLKSRVMPFEITVDADVVPSAAIKYQVPFDSPSHVSEEAAKTLRLAEKRLSYHSVDMILGNEYYDRCVLSAIATFDGVLYRNTNFGWTATSPINRKAPRDSSLSCSSSFVFMSTKEIQNDLRKFWEIEEVLPTQSRDPEQTVCERHFEETFSRTDDGRFIVRLPLKTPPEPLGESYSRALRSLINSERRQRPEIRKQYVEFMDEYQTLNHMSLIPASEKTQSDQSYYIPHHAVIKPTSATTKLRVVFNASAPTIRGPSLNQILMCGPKLQPDLCEILVAFRSHPVAFSADIAKMYRQILIHSEDRRLQRILWRSDSNAPIREFELNTLTYATVPASFIATKCLSVLADSISETHPKAAKTIKNCFYMDDLLCSCATVEEAEELQHTIHKTLLKGQFPLRKYLSNSQDLLNRLDPSLTLGRDLSLLPESTAYILDLIWEPNQDVFRVKVSFVNEVSSLPLITKRIMLSVCSKIFDPLGFVSPLTIRFKILIQNMWKEKRGWDEPASDETVEHFLNYVQDLKKLKDFTVRRPYSVLTTQNRQLIGFCDASIAAYCAVVYMRTISDDNREETYLICSKTKVAPISKSVDPLNIHHLELIAAAMLTELIRRLSTCLEIDINDSVCYSDSQVTLSWLAKSPETWKQFVRNRVAKIQEVLPYSCWRYVKTNNNPADLSTRGISAEKLISNQLWLRDRPTEKWLEEKILTTTTVAASKVTLFDSSSSFFRLQSAVARILRWRNRSRSKVNELPDSPSTSELSNAFVLLVKYAQGLDFTDEISQIKENKSLNRRSKLRNLEPILDENGIMRISGRLENANVSFEKKHPIIMNAKNPFILLYAKYIHEEYFHAGVKFIITFLESKFRFVQAIKPIAKSIVYKCVTCARYHRRVQEQLMAHLPPEQISISSPFSNSVIDFAGPFETKCVGHRSVTRFKGYLCVFVCLATRAVHLEFLSGLETSHFLLAFNRFKARRETPAKLFSDNGPTFVKADKVLRVDWQFGPPYGPHHQGLAEAAVKSAKVSLNKVTKGVVMTFEEYSTLFAKIEAVLNSRPLCQHRDSYLTPGHFLTGKHLLIPSDVEEPVLYLTVRFQLVEKIFRDFWRSWSSQYLNQLNNRTKWRKKNPNLQPGDIVLVSSPNSKPTAWPITKIVAVHHSAADSLVRKVTVQIGGKTYERPITRLILLPIENSCPESSRGTVSSVLT